MWGDAEGRVEGPSPKESDQKRAWGWGEGEACVVSFRQVLAVVKGVLSVVLRELAE